MLLFQGVNAWRQHLPEASRVHAIVTEGGAAPNIVPESAACQFNLRADNDRTHAEMVARFKDIVRGAELMTGTTAEIVEPETPLQGLPAKRAVEQGVLRRGRQGGD